MTLSRVAKDKFGDTVDQYLKDRRFNRYLVIMDLWDANRAFSLEWSTVPSLVESGTRRQVRCSIQLEELITELGGRSFFVKEPVK